MIHGGTLLVLILTALMFANPVCGGQNGPKTQADGKQGSTFPRIYDDDQKDRINLADDAKRREEVQRLVREGKV
ncbi:MAG TPA: hypothetical protein VN946_03140 [Terriglobales bacterium]|nr:hypothetical protein [Terriglobales bacterium]